MIRTVLSAIGVLSFYTLSFMVNPWVAGVMLVAHIGYEYTLYLEAKNAAKAMSEFVKILNDSVEGSEEPPHNIGNC